MTQKEGASMSFQNQNIQKELHEYIKKKDNQVNIHGPFFDNATWIEGKQGWQTFVVNSRHNQQYISQIMKGFKYKHEVLVRLFKDSKIDVGPGGLRVLIDCCPIERKQTIDTDKTKFIMMLALLFIILCFGWNAYQKLA
jgi:hypothetical protein